MRAQATDRGSTLQLADGRLLRYLETGPRDGAPVFYCHGAIGTPLGRSLDLQALTERLRIRYIAVNRPGIGGSDRAPRRAVIDFASDLEQLADRLALERFGIVGVSAGGPYALAAGSGLGDRVSRVAVCSSLSPLCARRGAPGMPPRVRFALKMVAAAPALCAVAGDLALPLVRSNPKLLHAVIRAHAAPTERGRLRESGERQAATASFLDATAYGVRGMIDDYCCYSRDWGFRMATVSPTVHVWHGTQDPLVPLDHALALAISLPRCRMFLHPDEGHHFFRRRLEEILAALLGRHRSGAGTAA
jgi:pimeloyl-ACP methyl ester carboxylesterase